MNLWTAPRARRAPVTGPKAAPASDSSSGVAAAGSTLSPSVVPAGAVDLSPTAPAIPSTAGPQASTSTPTPGAGTCSSAPNEVDSGTLTPDRAEVRNDPSSVGHHGGRALALANDTTTCDRAEGALRPSAASTGPGIVPERPNDEGAGHRPTVAAAAPPTPVGSYLDFITDLEDALATAEAARPPREFSPDTEERVDWLLRKLFEDQERASRIRAAAEARCAEIDGRMRYLASKYAAPLAEFVESELPKARRGAKSIRLSEGIVGFRDEKGGPRVEDVRAVERWAEAHDDPTAPRFGEWAYRVDKDRVLAHVLATGESVPGVEIREPKRLLYAQSDLRDPRGKKAMKTIQITRLAAEALVAPPADEPEEE